MPISDFPNESSGICPYVINHVENPVDLDAIISLIEEYTAWIGIDLSFQGYQAELSSMPGKYARSAGGCLLIARDKATNEPLGCAAMRALPNEQGIKTCEMKRLYVSPAGRRYGLGKTLAIATIVEAKSLGYSQMYLDTLPFMEAALKLYERLGFRRVDKYYDTPQTETIFLAKNLVDD